jgi:hypothetical protein
MSNPFKNSLAIAVDVENWYHIPSVYGSPFSAYKSVEGFYSTLADRYDYPTEPTHRVLELLNQSRLFAEILLFSTASVPITDFFPISTLWNTMRRGANICYGCAGYSN